MLGKKIAVCVAVLCSLCFAQSNLSDNIVIDQFGYRPNAQKTAVVRNPKLGDDATASFAPGDVYRVVNEGNGATAFEGAPVHKFALDSASGDEVWWFDFSEVNTPGRYHVLDVSNNVRSFSFSIAEDVYNDVLKHAVRMFYYQRAGFAKVQPYAEASWVDGASHLQDSSSRLFSDPNNAALARDLRGGWYDAGDYNKYTAWAASYIETMLLAYLERPEAFTDDYNIPESGNGIPDIIDEAKWGMDWLLRMQNPDGSVLSIVGYGAQGASPPSQDRTPSRYGPPNTIATISAAKAYALGAMVFSRFEQTASYAGELRTAALKAYDWAVAHPDSIFHNNVASNNSQGLGAGNQEPGPDGQHDIRPKLVARMQAAMYLYELTGDASYLSVFEANNAYRTLPLYRWGHMDMYRFDNHTMYMWYLNLDGGSATVKSDVRSQLITAFQPRYGRMIDSCAYRAKMEGYVWGSNQHVGNNGTTFWLFAKNDFEPQHSARYMETAENYLHYLHGVNPLNLVFLSNMNNYGASRSLNEIFHSWFDHGTPWDNAQTSTHGPAPAFLAGGPNAQFRWDGCCPASCGEGPGWSNNTRCFAEELPVNQPPMKMYKDFNTGWPLNSWEVTEPMGAYQLTYIRLLSKFVQPKGSPLPNPVSVRNSVSAPKAAAYSLSVRSKRGVLELRLKGINAQSVELFNLRGVKIAALNKQTLAEGNHRFSTKGFAKQMAIVRVKLDDNRVKTIPVRIE
ncbi:MAG: glycoside hydrolase family 9 protein [Chitinispirillia bacterium]|nr:glycoside hydrolase family 9 protein [Chitinispirillia bacterium]